MVGANDDIDVYLCELSTLSYSHITGEVIYHQLDEHDFTYWTAHGISALFAKNRIYEHKKEFIRNELINITEV